MNICFDNNSLDQEESRDINYIHCLEDSFENKNDNDNDYLFFNESKNFFYDDFSFEEKNFMTEENKDDKFDGNFNLDDSKKSKTMISMYERTRDTEIKGKDKKSKFKNGKDEIIFNQEKHNEKIIKDEKSRNDDISKNTQKIFNITKEYERQNKKGRKRKFNLSSNGKHDKFCYDNIVRKVKTKLFEIILFFINLSIIPIEKENQKKNSKKKEFYKPLLVKIDQEIIKTINVEDNLELLESKLKDIFSNKTSKKYKHLGLDRNKEIIDEIYEQKIQKKTISILNKTFDQCLDHINGINYDEDLAGLELRYLNIFKDLRSRGNSEDYISEFKYMVKNFKSFYKNKKARKKKE
jgi:hypothetical protein